MMTRLIPLEKALNNSASPRTVAATRGKADGGPNPPEQPIPLYPPIPKSEPYPVDALGLDLAPVTRAISRKIQVPQAVAAQSVLAVAGLAAQSLADVQLPFGQRRPLSLYLMSIAGSGDRKTTTDGEALWPVRRREQILRTKFEADQHDWIVASAAWAGEKRSIESKKGLTFDARKEALRLLGPEPASPLFPILTAPDPTVEGLAKIWPRAHASLGLFSAEGGQLIGGPGFSHENALKTAGAYSELWDGRGMRRLRAGDGLTLLPGRRLSMHLMVQPEAAAAFLSNPMLRDQGLLSRFLLAAPESLAGSRFCQQENPEDETTIRVFGARILSLLEMPWPLAAGKSNELELPTLALTDEAQHIWRNYADQIETLLGPEALLASLRDVGSKSAEQAARIAGVLTIVRDPAAETIDAMVMANATKIARWYLDEALLLHNVARTNPRLRLAQSLLDWVQAKGITNLSLREVLRKGPTALRTKDVAEEAIKVLTDHNWLVAASSGRSWRWQVASAEPQ